VLASTHAEGRQRHMRVHISGEDVSEALINAGIELRPEDTLMTKFWQIAEELTNKFQRQARQEITSSLKSAFGEDR